MYLHPTSPFEILCVVKQLNCHKSCGMDGIDAKFVQLAAEVFAPALSLLFIACFDNGFFPTGLKEAKVVPVFKSGDKQKLTNYRPISILPCLSKILEKIVYSRTIDFLNSHSVLCPTQYGFRPKQSTAHAILDTVLSCFDNVKNKKFTGLLLLDLIKAFDTVQHKILLAKLNHYGIQGVVNNFFESYLPNRSQAVIIHDNHFLKSNIDIRVPQDSSLGSLLFLLYRNDLPNCIRSTPRLFADDTCILVKANTSNELKYSLNYELAKINGWIVANKLTLNADKSSAIIIKPKLHSPPVEMNLSCAAESIKVVSSAKKLNAIIDDKLNFQEHVKHLDKKVSRSVGILSKLKTYLPTHVLFKLYCTLVHSHLLYGLIVWGNTYSTYLSKLITLHNKALRIVT